MGTPSWGEGGRQIWGGFLGGAQSLGIWGGAAKFGGGRQIWGFWGTAKFEVFLGGRAQSLGILGRGGCKIWGFLGGGGIQVLGGS